MTEISVATLLGRGCRFVCFLFPPEISAPSALPLVCASHISRRSCHSVFRLFLDWVQLSLRFGSRARGLTFRRNVSGSGHALLGLRADWRQQLAEQQKALGWRYVRFHGVLDDDMSVLQMRNGQPLYSFFNIDSIYDFLLSINMKPIIELGFMPEDIASGNATVFHYKGNTTPPKTKQAWYDLIQTLVKHLIDRYGADEVRTWPFEVWNEPNCGFFSGTQQQYFDLMEVTFRAIKSVDMFLSVGGPATCASGWINETLAWEARTGITLDFISTHMYPTDWGDNVPRDIVHRVLSSVRKTVGPQRQLYYTEYNSGLWCCPQIQHDTPYAAAFVMATIPRVYGLVDILSYWEFSDIFEGA